MIQKTSSRIIGANLCDPTPRYHHDVPSDASRPLSLGLCPRCPKPDDSLWVGYSEKPASITVLTPVIELLIARNLICSATSYNSVSIVLLS